MSLKQHKIVFIIVELKTQFDNDYKKYEFQYFQDNEKNYSISNTLCR